MTTKKTCISNDQYWDKLIYDQSLDFDDQFSPCLDFIYQEEFMIHDTIIKDETSSSPEVDQYHRQPSSTDGSPVESYLPNFICGVCGASAHGYNFAQITCESCKAFFRRNALRYMPHLTCRFEGSCVINVQTRRDRTYCRLKKCFDIKMRKDWIRTDEERELRQLQKLAKTQKKLTNDQQPLLNLPIVVQRKRRLMIKTIQPPIQELVVRNVQSIFTESFFGFHCNLSDEDQVLLNNITQAYQFGADQSDGFHINNCTQSKSSIQFINRASDMHQSLIYFYKQIPEFKQVDIVDQILLIKCNVINLIHIHYIIKQNFQESPWIGIHMSRWINEDFHYQMSGTHRYFDRFIEHPLILKLALVVLLFSINLSTPRESIQFDDYTNRRKLYEIQNYYTAVLWRYLNHLFDEREAVRSMEIIVMQILRYQTLMNTMEEIIRRETDYLKRLSDRTEILNQLD